MKDEKKKKEALQQPPYPKQHILTREDEEMFKQDNYEKQYYDDAENDRD